MEKFEELLLKDGIITREQLERALLSQRIEGGVIGTILVKQGAITEEVMLRYQAKLNEMAWETEKPKEEPAGIGKQVIEENIVPAQKKIIKKTIPKRKPQSKTTG